MPAKVVSHRFPDSLLNRIKALSERTGLKEADITRMAIMRGMDLAEQDPAALLRFTPELAAMDGRRKVMARVAESDHAEPAPVQTPVKVDYRTLKAPKKQAKKPRK